MVVLDFSFSKMDSNQKKKRSERDFRKRTSVRANVGERMWRPIKVSYQGERESRGKRKVMQGCQRVKNERSLYRDYY